MFWYSEPTVNIIWATTGILSAAVGLRLYTRIACVAPFALDDCIYFISYLLKLLLNIILQISVYYGFGRTFAEVDNPRQYTMGAKYEAVAQMISIVTVTVAKFSLGFFLLRLMQVKWHRISVWTTMSLLSVTCVVLVLAAIFRCKPIEHQWDPAVPGSCPVNLKSISYMWSTTTIFADVWFAMLPWLFIWRLKLAQRERLLISGSLSLGVFAAICGIIRTTAITPLDSPEFLRESRPLVLWSAIEHAVTMICIAIPTVILPLWRRARRDGSGAFSCATRGGNGGGGGGGTGVPSSAYGGPSSGAGKFSSLRSAEADQGQRSGTAMSSRDLVGSMTREVDGDSDEGMTFAEAFRGSSGGGGGDGGGRVLDKSDRTMEDAGGRRSIITENRRSLLSRHASLSNKSRAKEDKSDANAGASANANTYRLTELQSGRRRSDLEDEDSKIGRARSEGVHVTTTWDIVRE